MLILTRRLGDAIKIGDDIEVTITGIDRNQVRVGIKAPTHIAILRDNATKLSRMDEVGGKQIKPTDS